MKPSSKAIDRALSLLTATPTVKPLLLDPSFAVQNDFINDKARFLAAQCSRRAGKTNALAIRFFKTLEKYPGSQSVYLGLTLESAMDIMWPVLEELDERYGIGCTFTPSTRTVYHPNGAKLRLYGADQKDFIKKLKGRKFPAVAIDEAQDFGAHLQKLVDDVLTPATADYEDGWIALTGTPGPVPQGYFFEITQNKRFGYSFHEWTLIQNPYMPNPAGFIAELMAKREWDETNPTLLREYRNKWVLDVNSLWIHYVVAKDDYANLPPGAWHYALGIDVGFKDADALAVIGWTDDSPDVYLIEEVVAAKQGLTELVEQVNALSTRYSFDKMIMDEGGLGKKLAEEMRRRHHIPVQPADKARKQENVEILNDALRLGRFKAKKDSRFAQDSYLVQIDWDKSTPNRIVVKKKPHSDIIDAVLYAFKESPAFTYEAPPYRPARGTKEWADLQAKEQWEAAVAHFEEQADLSRRIANGGFDEDY